MSVVPVFTLRVLLDASLSMDVGQENGSTLLQNVLQETIRFLREIVEGFPAQRPGTDLRLAVDIFSTSYSEHPPLVLQPDGSDWTSALNAYIEALHERVAALGVCERGGTALYDSIVKAYSLFPAGGPGRLLVVTDGEDTVSSVCRHAAREPTARRVAGENAVRRASLTRLAVATSYIGTSDIGHTLEGISQAAATKGDALHAPPLTFTRTSSDALTQCWRSASVQVSQSMVPTGEDEEMEDEDEGGAAGGEQSGGAEGGADGFFVVEPAPSPPNSPLVVARPVPSKNSVFKWQGSASATF